MKRWICPRCLHQGEASQPGPTACPSCDAPRPAAGWAWVFETGEVLDRHYRIERMLAVGSAGPTYLACQLGPDHSPIEPRLAIKVLFPSHAEGPFLRQLATEAQVLQQLSHRHIVQLRGFVHRTGHEPYLVTRYEAGGTLAAHVARHGPLSDNVALGIATQIARALAVTHRHGVAHRDLTPHNVVLETKVNAQTVPHCRLADFGLAGALVSGAGNPEFAAPEQFSPQPTGPAADVFAIGALLWWMVEGEPLVRLTDPADPKRCLDDWVLALAHRSRGRRSPEVERWFDQTLVLNPKHRPAAVTLVDEGDATLVGSSDLEGDEALTNVPAPPRPKRPPAVLSSQDGLAIGGGEEVDPTEINAAWPTSLESPPATTSSSGVHPPSVLTSYTGSYRVLANSGPRTLSGLHSVHEPTPVSNHQGLPPVQKQGPSTLTVAAFVVFAFLVAAAGVIVGYVAMSTWGS
ncbi:MAG: protein kinase [Myxococcota bacterium]